MPAQPAPTTSTSCFASTSADATRTADDDAPLAAYTRLDDAGGRRSARSGPGSGPDTRVARRVPFPARGGRKRRPDPGRSPEAGRSGVVDRPARRGAGTARARVYGLHESGRG